MASRKEGMNIGPYRVIEQIGVGGMATVYKAYQPAVDRYVALKILPSLYARDPQFVERFNQEARTIASLEHRSILAIYDFGEDAGVTYLAMRYLEGGTLKDALAHGRLPLSEVARVIEQVASGLDYAHRRGVIHRDVKPANIMIDDEGAVYLTDFGIAKVLEGSSNMTKTGSTIGTPTYMSPEQCQAQPVDGRSDIYSLGVVLYELVLGRVPYQAETPLAVVLAHVHEPLPLPREVDPSISEEIERVIIKALAKDPDDRYQRTVDLAAAFSEALSQSPPVQSGATATLQMLINEVQQTRTPYDPTVSLGGQAAEQDMDDLQPVAPVGRAQQPVIAPPKRGGIGLAAILGGFVVLIVIAAVVGGVLLLGGSPAEEDPAPPEEPESAAEEPGTEPPAEAPGPTAVPLMLGESGPGGQLYDDFNDAAFDGDFNRALWYQGTDGTIGCAGQSQEAGVFKVASDGTANTDRVCWIAIASDQENQPRMEDVGGMSARIQIEDNPGSYYLASIVRLLMEGGGIAMETRCGVDSLDPVIHFNVYDNSGPGEGKHVYNAFMDIDINRWYTVWLQVNPVDMSISCFVDGVELGTYVPSQDMAGRMRDANVYWRGYLNARQPGSTAVTLMDDFTVYPSDIYLYDEFDDRAYEGAFDSSRWVYDAPDDACSISQQDGFLVVSNDPGPEQSCNLSVAQPELVPGRELGIMETIMQIQQGFSGEASGSALRMSSEENLWSADCGILTGGSNAEVVFAVDATPAIDGDELFVRSLPVSAGRFYNVALLVDPETMTFSCQVDGEEIGSIAPDNPDELTQSPFRRQLSHWRVQDTQAIVLYENIRLVTP